MLRDKNKTDNSLRNFIVSFNDKDYSPIHVSFGPLENYLQNNPKEEYHWAILNQNQCPCCTLTKEEHPYCPAALSIASLLASFRDFQSTERVTIEAEDSIERKTIWKTDLQIALFVLTRTAMFSSGCPITEEFRGFITDLRAFATQKEIQKALIIRFLLMCKGDKEAAAQEVTKRTADLHYVSQGLVDRIQAQMKGDAIINSLVINDSVALLMDMNFDEVYQEIYDEIQTVEDSGVLHS